MTVTPITIAIDGPSGSGKSSVSRAVAARLGLQYLDTGAMYRALTFACLTAGLELTDAEAVAAFSRTVNLRMGTDPAAPSVSVGERRVDDEIREPEISSVVSQVATNLAVREELRRRQRELIDAGRASGGMVAEGRDITTVVAPDADVRILLTADPAARLARRAAELHGTTDAESLSRTEDQIMRRDRDDSTVSEFTVAADGVVQLDSTPLDFDQTVEAVLTIVKSVTEQDVS